MLTPRPSPRAGLYIHVPFCTSVCPYCDFAVTIAGRERRDAWTEAVVREGSMHTGCDLEFETVYLGGGTPSSLPPERLGDVLSGLRRHLEIQEDARVHIEANPEDVTRERVEAWRSLGVDFVSLGAQAFDDACLTFLGRRHTARQVETSLGCLMDAGFHTVSIDLIYGVAGQDPAAWRGQLERAVASGVQHLSCYQLTFHEGTVLDRRLRRGLVSRVSVDLESELFFLTHEVLAEAGFEGYEVSNFASDREHRSLHNQKYWDHTPYLGLGPSAHSWAGGRRWWNIRKLRLWQRAVGSGRVPIEGHERPTGAELALEALMLGLRTTGGVNLDRVREQFCVDLLTANRTVIGRMVDEGLLTLADGAIRPTLEGMAVADTLARAFVLPD